MPKSDAGSTIPDGPAARPTAERRKQGTAPAARRWDVASRADWPPPFQRLVFAVAGWLPPALAVAYASGTASGCDRAAVSCPAGFEVLQLVTVGALLGVLLALPRAAYVAAAGSAALAVVAVGLVVVYSAAGIPQPLPNAVALLTVGLWVGGYVLGALAAGNDWPLPRPWLRDTWAVRPDEGPASLGVARPSRRV